MFVVAPRSLFAFPVRGNEKVTVYDPTSGWPYVAADCAARDFRSGGSDMRGWFWQQGRVCGRTTYDQRHHNPSLEVPAISMAVSMTHSPARTDNLWPVVDRKPRRRRTPSGSHRPPQTGGLRAEHWCWMQPRIEISGQLTTWGGRATGSMAGLCGKQAWLAWSSGTATKKLVDGL